MEEKSVFALNEFSDDAKDRSALFESLARKEGFIVLPGRYGGEYNNDMLAIRQSDDQTILMLGLKVTAPEHRGQGASGSGLD